MPDASVADSPPAPQVLRPDPGLARGVWETQPGVLYGMGGAVVLFGAAYGAYRLGIFRRRAKQGR